MVDGSKVFSGSGGKDIGKLIGLRQARLEMGTVSCCKICLHSMLAQILA